jgi:hypothetical protein
MMLRLHNKPTESARHMNHIAHLRKESQLKICDFSGETFQGFAVL